MTKAALNHNVLYIEPISHPEFLCHVVFAKGRTLPMKTAAEHHINHVLIECFGASIASRKLNVKRAHNIKRLVPIIIDDTHDFVMFPLHSCKYNNAIWLNLRHVMKFIPTESGTMITFRTGDTMHTHVESKVCEKQYRRALEVLDYFKKFKHLNISYTIE